jgi:hypothetical protein
MNKDQKYGLCIGTPFTGEKVNVQYMESMIKTHNYFRKAGIPLLNIYLYNCSLITKARNDIISQFYNKSTLDYFIFIDSDMSWNPEDIVKLMNDDKEVIGATYPKKVINWREIQQCTRYGLADNVGEMLNKTSEYTVWIKNKPEGKKQKLIKVNRLGTGFMMIKRSVIKKLKRKFKDLIYLMDDQKSKGIAIFESQVKNGEHLSEDYAFCERVQEVGTDILINPSLEINHHGGNMTFNGNFKNKLKYEQEIQEILRNS